MPVEGQQRIEPDDAEKQDEPLGGRRRDEHEDGDARAGERAPAAPAATEPDQEDGGEDDRAEEDFHLNQPGTPSVMTG